MIRLTFTEMHFNGGIFGDNYLLIRSQFMGQISRHLSSSVKHAWFIRIEV